MRNAVVRLSFIALLAAAHAPAATLRSLVSEGNERYEVKEYEEALKAYRLAAEQSPQSHHAHFNLGAALYRTGEYTQAIGAFQHAAQMAREGKDQPAEALSRYNLGNSFFRSSEADAQTNPRQAMGALENSVESYRQALDLDPTLANAEHNIALARKKMKELLDQMRNSPAGGGSQDQREQLKDKVEQNLQQQKELSEKREELEQQQDQQSDHQKQAEQLAQEQQQLEQQSRELSEQLDKPQATPQQQQARENLEQAAQQQQKASQQLAERQLQQAEGAQQRAQQSLEEALASLGGNPQQSEASPRPQQPGPSQQQREPQQLQALEQTPQDILNEERSNRRRRRMLMLGAQAQVDKDW